MTDSPPPPLTPPDCNLQVFRDMPFDVGRFRDSDLMTHADPEAIVAAILLWGAAWHQVPAASLPDDDRVLARYAGYGRAVDKWLEVRAGALRGFVLCADARLYHRTLAEKANAAWDSRLKYEWAKAGDRHRKAQRQLPEDERSDFPAFEDWRVSRARADGCNDHAGSPESPQKRQGSLPLESGWNSGGSRPVRAPARTERAHTERARTGASAVPDGNSDGNDDEFRRKDGPIPTETALKGTEGNGILESPQLTPSRSKPARDEAGQDNPPGLLQNADLKALFDACCDAAGFHPTSPTVIANGMALVGDWQKQGMDFDTVVVPTIRAIIAESQDRTRSLHRFRDQVQHEHARHKAASRKKARTPAKPAVPLLDPEDEDERFRPLRARLLERLGPDQYSGLFNRVRFEAVDHADRLPLRVRGPEHLTEGLVHGNHASILRNAAHEAGFKEVWK